MGFFKKIKKVTKRAVAAVATGGGTEVLRLVGQKETAKTIQSVLNPSFSALNSGLGSGSGAGQPPPIAVQPTYSQSGPPPPGIGGGSIAFGSFGASTVGGTQQWRSSAVSTTLSTQGSRFSDNRAGSWEVSGTSVRRFLEPQRRPLVRL